MYLINVGLASYNIHQNVPAHIPVHNQFIPSENLLSEQYLKEISNWTNAKKMKLNERKTKNLVFNFSKKYQFATQLSLNGTVLETPSDVKLLGTIISNDLKWDKNIKMIVQKANKRMQMLYSAAQFTSSMKDLKDIYVIFIRSILEHSCVVWHSGLSKKNSKDLERIQKMAVRVMMGKNFETYGKSLNILNLTTLHERREKLCLKFAEKCTKNEKVKHWFPLKNQNIKTRSHEKYKTFKTLTKRFKNSALPFMRRLLNNEENKRRKMMRF